ncbi:NarK/NasA family nitrate transporter [Streptomyces sp. ISL-12]|uniref:MFS transporter n=1 Tax=Streptomyces sp. ISL-12 TaxID=2819177 RepID=UPI001BE91B02|nr:MFS transporter [Streptomyces sp. ISL-12]MBT2410985.1 NarK/NasA family nitrate transporter [Streptomyces sp. ISL-12]
MAHTPARQGSRLTGWDPEDEDAWHRGGHRMARRNLVLSALAEHVGFSVWSLWSVLVLFMSPGIGLDFGPDRKFLLVATPTVVGSLLRLPYARAVTRFGGRDWTVFSTALLLLPTLAAAYFVQRPGTPFWVFLAIGALAGVGGGGFASSMTNVAAFYPRRLQGWALGVTAGAGNLGVAAVQLVGLLVLSAAGDTHPAYVAAGYLPLIVAVALLAAWKMDNVDTVRAEPGAQREAVRDRRTWCISLLYIGTFGSFIGYGFAFGLVLRHEFALTAREAVGYTFLGPLLGAFSRPLGGVLADRLGSARVTFWAFLGMAAGTGVLVAAAHDGSFALFVTGFTVLFVLTGLGNGSTYKMIPALFARQAEHEVTVGADADRAFARARRLTGAVIAVAGAVGVLGGTAVNVAFELSYTGGSPAPAFLAFLAYYAFCLAVLRTLRPGRAPAGYAPHPDAAKETSRV